MQPKMERRHRTSKPNWRERRRLRTTAKYREIRSTLGTSDSETLLLVRLGDRQNVEVGQTLGGPQRWRSHVVVGLSAGLTVGSTIDVTSPWFADIRSDGVDFTISRRGSVLLIERRHLHRLEPALAGRVEPVGPIAESVRRLPLPRPEQPVASGDEVAPTPTPKDRRALAGHARPHVSGAVDLGTVPAARRP